MMRLTSCVLVSLLTAACSGSNGSGGSGGSAASGGSGGRGGNGGSCESPGAGGSGGAPACVEDLRAVVVDCSTTCDTPPPNCESIGCMTFQDSGATTTVDLVRALQYQFCAGGCQYFPYSLRVV